MSQPTSADLRRMSEEMNKRASLGVDVAYRLQMVESLEGKGLGRGHWGDLPLVIWKDGEVDFRTYRNGGGNNMASQAKVRAPLPEILPSALRQIAADWIDRTKIRPGGATSTSHYDSVRSLNEAAEVFRRAAALEEVATACEEGKAVVHLRATDEVPTLCIHATGVLEHPFGGSQDHDGIREHTCEFSRNRGELAASMPDSIEYKWSAALWYFGVNISTETVQLRKELGQIAAGYLRPQLGGSEGDEKKSAKKQLTSSVP